MKPKDGTPIIVFVTLSVPYEIVLTPGDPGYEGFLSGETEDEDLVNAICDAVSERKLTPWDVGENLVNIEFDFDNDNPEPILNRLMELILANPDEMYRKGYCDEGGFLIPVRWLDSGWNKKRDQVTVATDWLRRTKGTRQNGAWTHVVKFVSQETYNSQGEII